jgi:hypothetical protein
MEDKIVNEEPKEPKPQQKSEELEPQRNWGSQIIGAMIGAFVFLVIGGVASYLGWVTLRTDRLLLWGGVVGGFIGSIDSLATAGLRLTKKNNKWLNVGVSFLGMLVFFGIVFGLSRLVGWILSLFNF